MYVGRKWCDDFCVDSLANGIPEPIGNRITVFLYRRQTYFSKDRQHKINFVRMRWAQLRSVHVGHFAKLVGEIDIA